MFPRFFFALAAFVAVPCVAAQANADSAADRLAGEALCGPEIVTVGDAWEHVNFEMESMRELLLKDDLVRFPQKTAALCSHLVFMRRRSIMVWGVDRTRLNDSIGRVLEAAPRWNQLALGGDANALEREVARLEGDLKAIAAQYPDEALISTNAAALLLPPAPLTLRIELAQPPSIGAGRESVVRFHLKTLFGAAEPPEALLITHTQKLHALLLDPAFLDYHHAHPRPTGKPGEYEFRFVPRTDGPYRLWLDVLPSETGREEFPVCDLAPIPDSIPRPPELSAPQLRASADGFVCELSLMDGALKTGEMCAAGMSIRDLNGQPVKRLQPVMGAFAHIVGFADDYKTVLHIHPSGPMPKAGEFGGPMVEFKFRPVMAGELRLFVQFSIDDAPHVAEFAVRCE